MNSGAIAGGAIAVIAEAIKASGAIVRVGSEDFLNIIRRSERPLIVMAKGGFLNKSFDYLTGYKGMFFLPGQIKHYIYQVIVRLFLLSRYGYRIKKRIQGFKVSRVQVSKLNNNQG